jgi:hypothetical protein
MPVNETCCVINESTLFLNSRSRNLFGLFYVESPMSGNLRLRELSSSFALFV